MKKLSYLVVGLLIFSSFAAVGIGKDASVLMGMSERLKPVNYGVNIDSAGLTFSVPAITYINIDGTNYAELEVAGANQYIPYPGEPLLPAYTTTKTYPLGTKIISVELNFNVGQVKTMQLVHKIKPMSQPLPVAYAVEDEAQYLESEQIYNSVDLYPSSWVSYVANIGLDENSELKTFLNIRSYPVRYSPATDTIKYIDGSATLKITYKLPTNPMTFGDAYDLVIITPSAFTDELQPLVTHKIGKGISTTVKTTEAIYNEYTGVDKPEQIKYFIKDALETWGIKYVMLVGGMKSHLNGVRRDDANQGSADWWLPVRYSNFVDDDKPSNPDPNDPMDWVWDPGYISDLYYADIYKYENGNPVFDDWDSDNDGIIAEWTKLVGGKDILDLYPDVMVGRLPCRNANEVTTVVNKIINYEKTDKTGTDWYKKIVCVAGDSHDDTDGYNFKEGEITTEKVLTNNNDQWCPSQDPSMPSPPWTHVRLYGSNKDTDPSHTFMTWNILREWGNRFVGGCGHLFFEGHGNPTVWSSYYPNHENPGYFGGLYIYFMFRLNNGERLPVQVIGGCHTNMFNITLKDSLTRGNGAWTRHIWTYTFPAWETWGVIPLTMTGGGCIASIGNTGLGYGWVGGIDDLNGDGCAEPVTLEGLGGYIGILFYRALSESSTKILGEIYNKAVKDYIDVFHPYNHGTSGNGAKIDCKTVQQWPLFGDPTLKIGGYPSGGGGNVQAEIVEAGAGMVALPSETITFNGMASYGTGECTYSWDLDNDGVYTDAFGATVSNAWDEPGVYSVSLKVTDSTGKTDVYNTIVSVEPLVSTPDAPNGETNIVAGKTYTYTTDIDRADGYWNEVYYMYDWGDGTLSEGYGPYTIGEQAEVSHSWDNEGNYAVRVIAILVHNVPGDTEAVQCTEWSTSAEITASAQQLNNQQTMIPLFLKISQKMLPNLK